MIDAALWALRRLGRLPRGVWAFLALAALCSALVWWSEARRAAAYQQGKRDAAAGAVFDSVLLDRAAIRVAKQQAHTDTVVQRVVVIRTRVESLLVALPDSVRALPAVPALVATTQQLLVEVDTLTHAITAERAAWTEKAKVDSAAIYSLRVLATARGDTIATLKKRPTWTRLVTTTATVGVAAFLGGRR